MINIVSKISKGWGYEDIFCSQADYCGKFLVFKEHGGCTSMHFHANKDETWVVQSGLFQVTWIDVDTTQLHTKTLEVGSIWRNTPMLPHRLSCIEPGVVLEVSTADHKEDNYKIMPGSSQNGS